MGQPAGSVPVHEELVAVSMGACLYVATGRPGEGVLEPCGRRLVVWVRLGLRDAGLPAAYDLGFEGSD